MELRHLRYFVALADAPTFTAAAERVHVTQSTLSHQIRQLENELGGELFTRVGKRRVVLTDAGQTFLSYARRALSEVDTGRALLKVPTLEVAGELRVGAGAIFNNTFIPECAARFVERYPSVKLLVDELDAERITADVMRGELHVGITWKPQDLRDLTFEPLRVEELVLVVSPQHPLAGRKHIQMVDLHRRPLALSSSRYVTRTIIDSCFRSCGAEPVIAAEINNTSVLLRLIASTQLATIISRYAVMGRTDLSIVHLEAPTPTRTPGILWQSRDQPQFVHSFVTYVREAALDAAMSLRSTPKRLSGKAAPKS